MSEASVGSLTWFSRQPLPRQEASEHLIGPDAVVLAHGGQQGQLCDSVLLQLTGSKLHTGREVCITLKFSRFWSSKIKAC